MLGELRHSDVRDALLARADVFLNTSLTEVRWQTYPLCRGHPFLQSLICFSIYPLQNLSKLTLKANCKPYDQGWDFTRKLRNRGLRVFVGQTRGFRGFHGLLHIQYAPAATADSYS